VDLTYNLTEDPAVSDSFDATPASTAIDALVADRGVLAGANQTLRVEPVDPDKGPATLGESDLRLPSRRETDADGLYSKVRIDGGDLAVPQPRGIETAVDEHQAVPTGGTLQLQLPVAVSELAAVELVTRHSSPDETLVVRLQADEDGAPTAPDNLDQDIAQRKLDSNFVSPDGTTRFEFPEHTVDLIDLFLDPCIQAARAELHNQIENAATPNTQMAQGGAVNMTPLAKQVQKAVVDIHALQKQAMRDERKR